MPIHTVRVSVGGGGGGEGGGGCMSLFLFFKNVYALRVYGYKAAAKSATALQERTLAGRVFHSAGPRKNGRRMPAFVLASRRISPALA